MLAALSYTHWKEMPLHLYLNIHCKLHHVRNGDILAIQIREIRVAVWISDFSFGPPININLMRRVGGGALACRVCLKADHSEP